jgi:hypothetical protein
MKRLLLILCLVVSFVPIGGAQALAGEMDILVQKLVEKNVLTPSEAQIVVDETKVQVAKELANGESLSVPDWTQRIKWGGDVRFRTQEDWGKARSDYNGNAGGSAGTATITNPGSTGTLLADQRLRERVRGRFYMEGKVNDFTTAAVRIAGGASSNRSTNDTLGSTSTPGGSSGLTSNYFEKAPVFFDYYYIKFEAPREVIRDYGKYFNDFKLWLGRFPIPFNYSELVWDPDTNPSGIAVQYVSPDIKIGALPSTNIYGNLGMFWLDESASYSADPMLFGYQVGAKTETFGPFGSVLDISTAFYDFANMQDKNSTINSSSSAGTNTRMWAQNGDAGGFGNYRYEYNVFDVLLSLDNSKIMDFEFPHGFYADFIHNTAAPSENNGALIGAYIGKKKIKNPGDWKVRGEWRYIERDSVPDFMPDSDFYGFGTFTSSTVALNAGNNGLPAEGGTNGKGINLALEYQLFKNTALNFEYYWMEPIESWDKTDPWNELQIDVITKF